MQNADPLNFVYDNIPLTLFFEAPSGYSSTACSSDLRPNNNMLTRLEEEETIEELLTVEATEQQESSQEQSQDED